VKVADRDLQKKIAAAAKRKQIQALDDAGDADALAKANLEGEALNREAGLGGQRIDFSDPEVRARLLEGDEPPVNIDPPTPEQSVHEQAALIANDAGISEVDWLKRRGRENTRQLHRTKLSPERAKFLKDENRKIARALRDIRIKKTGGTYKPPVRRWKDAQRAAEAMADDLAGYIPPRSEAFYVRTAGAADTEAGRAIHSRLKSYVIDRSPRGKKPTGDPRLENFKPENYEALDEAVSAAVREVQGKRRSILSRRNAVQSEEDELKSLVTMSDKNPDIVSAKQRALLKAQDDLGIPRGEQIDVDAYDRLRTLLQGTMGRRRRSVNLMNEAHAKGGDYEETFLALRQGMADRNAVEQVAWTLRENPAMTPDEAADLFRISYYNDGTLRFDPTHITEMDELVLQRMFTHLTGADIADESATIAALGANGTLPPMNSKLRFREHQLRVGAWSPRAVDTAVEKGAWSIIDERKWWMDNYGQAPRWLTDDRIFDGRAFKTREAYVGVMNETGAYDETVRVGRILSKDKNVNFDDLAFGRKGEAGVSEVKAQKDWVTERQYMIQRYGSLVSDDGSTLKEAPWLMTPEELGAWAEKNAGLMEGVIGDADDLAQLQQAVNRVTQEYADAIIDATGMAGKNGDIALDAGSIHRATFDIVQQVAITTPYRTGWKNGFKHLFRPSSLLEGWSYFWHGVVTSNPAFTVLNISDPVLRGGWFRVTDPIARRTASAFANGRADNFVTSINALGMPEATAFFYSPQGRSFAQRWGRESYGNLDRIGATMDAFTSGLARNTLPRVENAVKLRLGKQLFANYWDELGPDLLKKGYSEEAIDLLMAKQAKDQLNKWFPTLANAGPAEKLLNKVFPFVSYYAKNQIIWVGQLLDHPWMIRLMHELQDGMVQHNKQEWEARHPGQTMPEHLGHQIRIPGTDTYIDIGVFTDAARGGQLVAGGANAETLGGLMNRVFRPLPSQRAMFDHALWRLTGHGERFKYIPVYDENGMWDGESYELLKVPPKTPWGAESLDLWTDLVWVPDLLNTIDEALKNGDIDHKGWLDIAGNLATFGAFSTPSKYYMLNQQYFALRDKSEDAAREWLNTEDGQLLQDYWRQSEDPTSDTKLDVFAIGKELITSKEVRERWLKNQSGDMKDKFFSSWDELDVMKDEWDAMMDLLEHATDEERSDMWALREAAFMEFYRQNPHLWHYQGMGMSPEEFAEFKKAHIQDLKMDEFYSLYGWDKKPENPKALAIWEKDREDYLKAFPEVLDEIQEVTNGYQRNRELVNKAWEEAHKGLDLIEHLRDQAYATGDKANVRAVAEAAEILGLAFDAEVFGQGGFAPPGEEPRFRLRGDTLARALKKAGDDPQKRREAFYGLRMEGAAREATDKKGNFDYLKWLNIIDKNKELKEMYFRKNPDKAATFQQDLDYAKFWKRFGRLAEQGRWDLAWETWDNAPAWLQDRMRSNNPEKFQSLEASSRYSGYMGKWVRMFDTHGTDAAMDYFHSLPNWVKERYYSNHPGKRMSSGMGTQYISMLDEMFGQIDNGDWDAAEKIWKSAPKWMRDMYRKNNPGSKLFTGKSGGTGGGLPDAQFKRYVKMMKKWVDLQKDGKDKAADAYFKSLPKWAQDFYLERHPDKSLLREDMAMQRLLAEYMGANKAHQQQMLEDSPRLARWLNENNAGAAWRNAVMYTYREIEDPWLKRVFREKYPEIFGAEARGERNIKSVMDTLEQNPEFSDAWLRWYRHIAASLEEALKYMNARPKDLKSDHSLMKRASHHGFSAEEVRKNQREYPRRMFQTNKRLPALEQSIR
jgi:hypothetical protein